MYFSASARCFDPLAMPMAPMPKIAPSFGVMAAIGAPLLTWNAARSLDHGESHTSPCTRSCASWSWDVQKVRTLGRSVFTRAKAASVSKSPLPKAFPMMATKYAPLIDPISGSTTLPLYSGFQRSSHPVGAVLTCCVL